MNMDVGVEISSKIKAAIKAKLMEIGSYVDDELPDYIMVMVANKKSNDMMSSELSIFLGDKAKPFCDWLKGVLDRLSAVGKEKREEKKEKKKRSSTETVDNQPTKSKKKKASSVKSKPDLSQDTTSSAAVILPGHDPYTTGVVHATGDIPGSSEEGGKITVGNSMAKAPVSHSTVLRGSSSEGIVKPVVNTQVPPRLPPQAFSVMDDSIISVSPEPLDDNLDQELNEENALRFAAPETSSLASKSSSGRVSADRSAHKSSLVKQEPGLESIPSKSLKHTEFHHSTSIGSTQSRNRHHESRRDRSRSPRQNLAHTSRSTNVSSPSRSGSTHRKSSSPRFIVRNPSPRVIVRNPSPPLHSAKNSSSPRATAKISSPSHSAVRTSDSRLFGDLTPPEGPKGVSAGSGYRHAMTSSTTGSQRHQAEVSTQEQRASSGEQKVIHSQSDEASGLDIQTSKQVASNIQVVCLPSLPRHEQASKQLLARAITDTKKNDRFSHQSRPLEAQPPPRVAVRERLGPRALIRGRLRVSEESPGEDCRKPDSSEIIPVSDSLRKSQHQNKTDLRIRLRQPNEKSSPRISRIIRSTGGDRVSVTTIADHHSSEPRWYNVSQGSSRRTAPRVIVSNDSDDNDMPQDPREANEDALLAATRRLHRRKDSGGEEDEETNFVVTMVGLPKNYGVAAASTTSALEEDSSSPSSGEEATKMVHTQRLQKMDSPTMQSVASKSLKQIVINMTPEEEDDREGFETHSKAELDSSSSPVSLPALPSSNKLQERCRFWPTCNLGDACPYVHPTQLCRMFPTCKFGSQCLYIHPPCHYDSKCRNPNCQYTHKTPNTHPRPAVLKHSFAPPSVYIPSSSRSVQTSCRYGNKCLNTACPYKHPKIHKLCAFGVSCKRKNCAYQHQTPAKYRWVKTPSFSDTTDRLTTHADSHAH